MKTCFHADVTLARGETFELRQGCEIRVLGTHGALWITVDHDVRDVVIEPGANFVSPVGGRCLVHALADTRARWCATDSAFLAPHAPSVAPRIRLPDFLRGAMAT